MGWRAGRGPCAHPAPLPLRRAATEAGGDLPADPPGQVPGPAHRWRAAGAVSVLPEGLPPLDREGVHLPRAEGTPARGGGEPEVWLGLSTGASPLRGRCCGARVLLAERAQDVTLLPPSGADPAPRLGP